MSLGSCWFPEPLPYNGITFSREIAALQTGHVWLFGLVSSHWCKHGQQKRWPHMEMTASFAASRQMLHSKLEVSVESSPPLSDPPEALLLLSLRLSLPGPAVAILVAVAFQATHKHTFLFFFWACSSFSTFVNRNTVHAKGNLAHLFLEALLKQMGILRIGGCGVNLKNRSHLAGPEREYSKGSQR